MQVKIIDVNQDTGEETFRYIADLFECYDGDADGYLNARDALKTHGRYYDGGGAAPLVLLMVAA